MIMPLRVTANTLLVASLALSWTLPAQAGDEDSVARCAKATTDSERIACLEAALRNQSGIAPNGAPVDDSVPELIPAPKKQVVASPPAGAEASLPVKEVQSSPRAEPGETNNTFGLKEEKPPGEADTITVTVTAVRKNLQGKWVFETSGGEVWLQTGQRVARFMDTPFDAEIRPAAMGSYFIRPSNGGVSVRVRREK